MADSGRLALGGVKFFVLDEADRLLDTGNQPDILNLFQRMPKGAAGAARLQVGFCLLFCQVATSYAKKGMFSCKHVTDMVYSWCGQGSTQSTCSISSNKHVLQPAHPTCRPLVDSTLCIPSAVFSNVLRM